MWNRLDKQPRSGLWAQHSSEEGLKPLLSVRLDPNQDIPSELNLLVPGNVDGFGMLNYLSALNVYISSDDGYNYFWDKTDGTACSDNTFAYNFGEDGFLMTGQCEWTDTYNPDAIGFCHGNMYRDCPYEDENRDNYPDCNFLTGFEQAIAKIKFQH